MRFIGRPSVEQLNFTTSAFNLQLLPTYFLEHEAVTLRAWAAGEPIPPDWQDPWLDLVRDATAEGQQISCLRMVTDPLSAYLRFQLDQAFVPRAAAGEHIRLIHASDVDVPISSLKDLWLLDRTTVQLLNHDEHGCLISSDRVIQPVLVTPLVARLDELWRRATPLDQHSLVKRTSTQDRVRAFTQALMQPGAIEKVHEAHELVTEALAPPPPPPQLTEQEQAIRDTLDLIEQSEDKASAAA